MKSLIIGTTFSLKDIIGQNTDLKIFSEIFNLTRGSWLVDRTDTTQLPFKTDLLDKYRLPDFDKILNLTLEECCQNRALELMSLDKRIYFLYSGGIDSTLALIAFIKSGIPRRNIVVVCNDHSIRENPNFYYSSIRSHFDVMATELFMQQLKTQLIDGIILSSEHGDSLYGNDYSSIAFELLGGKFLEKPATKENLITFFCSGGLSYQSAACWLDLYSANLKLCPRVIETVYDFLWWIGFNWRWQWCGEKMKLRTALDPDIQTFFSSDQLQKWAVTHKQIIIEKKTDFKRDYKQIILDYTKDQEYFDSKVKHVSFSIYYLANSYLAMESDGTKLHKLDYQLSKYYQKDNFISNWLNSN